MLHTDLPLFKLKGKELLPIVQGGMGVGISAHHLAGAVAKENAVGTIASIDLRRHHPDLMEQSMHPKSRDAMDRANLTALDAFDRESVGRTQQLAGTLGGPISKDRTAFCKASLNVEPMDITSPTDFICMVKVGSALGNFSNAHRGIFTTQ